MKRCVITEKQLNDIIKKAIKEEFGYGEDEVDARALADFCLSNDFFFVCSDPLFGEKERCANVSRLQNLIASEVLDAERLEFTDEANDKFSKVDTEDGSTRIVKVTMPNEVYYIAWEQ